jgi:hypothetical protein
MSKAFEYQVDMILKKIIMKEDISGTQRTQFK